jgi:hypothetical protein
MSISSVIRSDYELATFAGDRRNDPLGYKTRLSGKLYPNGEFTLGVVPPKRISEKERQYDRDNSEQYATVERVTRAYRGFEVETETYFQEGHYESSIGLSPLTNSHKNFPVERKPRGSKGITGHGKRMTRNGAWLQQKIFGKKQLGFLTVTLPSFPDRPDIISALGWDWSELVRQFLQEFTRAIKRSGNQAIWSGCTEIQEKRLAKYGDVAPHLHIVYHARNESGGFFVHVNTMRVIWRRIIDARILHYFGEEVEYVWGAAIDCASVKKDAGAYLGKYMSKGRQVTEMMTEKGLADMIPSNWWHCCLELKRAVKSLISDVPQDVKRAVSQGVDLVERGVMVYLFNIIIDEKTYGWIGKFKKSLKKDKRLQEILIQFYRPIKVSKVRAA